MISVQISIGPQLPEDLHVLKIPIQEATQLTITLSGKQTVAMLKGLCQQGDMRSSVSALIEPL